MDFHEIKSCYQVVVGDTRPAEETLIIVGECRTLAATDRDGDEGVKKKDIERERARERERERETYQSSEKSLPVGETVGSICSRRNIK